MAEGFGENVAPTAAIRAILNSYPFSIGLLREILQNSDDARASKQVFVLDRRFHDTNSVYHPYLATTQGPALLAYNNELIHDDDWRALQNIHRSSKIADTSKIGKYGIGFRSCYHITDTPHILSGSNLAILDPKHDFAEFHGVKVGGVKLNIESDWPEFSDNIAAFDAVLPCSERGKHFDGSIFRLPLRTSGGPISNQPVSPHEISELLRDFAREELNISLLFLRNVTSIEIYEVDMAGNKTEIARASIDRTPLESQGEYEIHKAAIRIHHLDGSSEEGEWRVVHAPFSEAVAVDTLSERLGGNPTAILSQHKLSPVMDFAIPLNRSDVTRVGRLFTYLPLPLRTEFPVHINALFSLTQSRQNLRNGGEIGIVKHSDDHALTEWNRLLFETYIPQVWGALLETLVKHDQIENIFDAWPRIQAEVQSGDYMYWKDMPLHVAQRALELPVWPAFGKGCPSYHAITSFLLADEEIKDDVLTALTRAGLLVTRPPQYITNIIRDDASVKILSPEIVHRELLYFVSEVGELSDTDAWIILTYLLSTYNCRYITGLPLVPSIAGPRTTLSLKTESKKSYTLFDDTEEQLFSAYDDEAVPLQQVPQAVRKALANQGPKILNLTRVDGPRVASYLDASPYAFQSQGSATHGQIRWLNQFWDWVQRWVPDLTFCNPYYLVPTTKGFKCPADTVFDTGGDSTITELFDLLDIPVVDSRLNKRTLGALEYLYPSSDIHALLLALPSTITADFSEEQAEDLCAHLLRYLPSSFARHNVTSANTDLRSRLRSLPVYPVISPSFDGEHQTQRTSIAANNVVRGVNTSNVPIFPQVDSITYLDLQSIHHNILQYVDARYTTPLSVSEMHYFMLQHLCAQSLDMQVAFVKHLNSNYDFVSRGVLGNLAIIEFVPATDGSLQMPKDLVDPYARLARLFPGSSSCLPDTTTPTLKVLARHLRELDLFITELSKDIIRDRIHTIASGGCLKPEVLACDLINIITDTGFDCRRLVRTSNLSLELEWIPTLEGLKSPLRSRDSFSHSGRKALFDEAFSMVVPGVRISASLRRDLKWDGDIGFEMLSQQLTKVLDGDAPPYEKVRQVVEELGNRNLLGSEVTTLRKTLQDRRWVPTRNNTLVSTQFALLGEEDLPTVGFHLVAYDPHHHSKMRTFLRDMGCMLRPSKTAILERLRELHSMGNEKIVDITQDVIRLLGWLGRLLRKERADLFIPDTNGTLCLFNDVYYNDVGPSACLYDIGLNRLAHPRISARLATDLGLKPLGLIGIHSRPEDDLDLEGDLDTIRDCLREYTDSQLLLEFFANASDAGATEFNILIDDVPAPTSALLSPRCREFNNVSSLVIHNDSTFTDDDFKGIMRTGVGGKSERKDTIGRFGLGALTMFYITEFAMIVSRDQVLFLNPSKSHLPVDRAALLLPLSTVWKLYKDHLSPLIGLFGFEPPEDMNKDYSYQGTIFRLPTRSEKQFVDAKPIFEDRIALEDLARYFKPLSSKCLLFTSVTTIRFFIRQFRTPLLRWSFTASRDQPLQVKENLNAFKITISSSDPPNDQEWRILSYTVDNLRLPSSTYTLEEIYRLRLLPVVQIASSSSPDRRHSLFSTLPLPLSLDLPVHISGPFILSFDRRSIWLNEGRGLEASYNLWLLKTVIPTLYLHFLEDRASLSDNAVYWPANIQIVPEDTYNDISTMVIDAVYRMAATSDNTIFRSKFQAISLRPRDTHLMFRLPRSVSKVLEMIMPSDVAQLPSSVTRRLQNAYGAQVSLVKQKYVHRQILQNHAHFSASNLEFVELQELIDFLIGDPEAFECLAGLRLLPLDDGSFANFGQVEDSCFYVAPPRVAEMAIFKPHRLVHRNLETAKLLDVDPCLNLQRITDENVGELLKDYVPVSPTLENANAVIQTWNTNFWTAFKLLDISMTTIANYPLVPTLRPGQYLSPAHCKAPSIVLANFSTQEWVSHCLFKMGFTLVNTASLPREARSALSSPEVSVGNVLALLFNRHESMVTLFDSLDTNLRLKLTSWIYAHFVGKKKGFFMKHGRYMTLPLWRTANGSFSPASDVQMLPKGVTIESVAPFASEAIVGYDMILESMGIFSPPSIRSMLNIPLRLESQLDDAYQILLQVLLTRSAQNSSIPVPNSQRSMRESNTLYSAKDELFLAAFGPNSEYFILPSFHNFEAQLEQFGLKRQRNLSLSMFKDCVEAFQNSTSGHSRDRAATIFQVFSEDLPLRVRANQGHRWRLFDDVRFIPRNMTPQPLGYHNNAQYFAPHVQNLPDLVSPNELVREEFQAIAWTQRALYDIQPDRRILMVHPTLSIPTAKEVVNHLTVLATRVALDRPKDPFVLDHIKQTYQWLNGHAEEAQDFLHQKENVALFLNVEDPASDTEDWVWKEAIHILLDTYDTGPLQYPRGFLKSFRSLLTAAGAVTIDYGPDIEIRRDQPTSEDRLLTLFSSFDQMRKERICTDVGFICSSPDDEPLYAHRGYLAAYTSYFKEKFSGSFREAGVASHTSPILVPVPEFSRRCVEYVLDYAYTAKAPDFKREDADIALALEMLGLAHLWAMSDAQLSLQDIIIKMKMVDPFNLDTVRATAQRTQSMDLIHHCDTYEERNASIVLRAREGSTAAVLN